MRLLSIFQKSAAVEPDPAVVALPKERLVGPYFEGNDKWYMPSYYMRRVATKNDAGRLDLHNELCKPSGKKGIFFTVFNLVVRQITQPEAYNLKLADVLDSAEKSRALYKSLGYRQLDVPLQKNEISFASLKPPQNS